MTLFGFAASPARREDRFSFSLLGGFPARPLQLLRGAGLLFGSLTTRPLQFLRSADLLFDPQCFHFGGGLSGRLTLLARLFLGLSCGDTEIASRDEGLPLLAPLGRLGTCGGGLGALDLRLPRFLCGAQPIGYVGDSRLGHLTIFTRVR